MRRPFPGMDPYLEARDLWGGLHLQIINGIVAHLQPQLLPSYVARPEERVLLEPLEEAFVPDVSVGRSSTANSGGVATATRARRSDVAIPEEIEDPDWLRPHRYVTLRDARTQQVVTVIEVLSPWNKSAGGREAYRRKQEAVLLSAASLVEIDLLRSGRHSIAVPESLIQPSDYRVCVHRAGSSTFELVRFQVRDPLPRVGIPLRGADQDVVLDLDSVIQRAYDDGAYDYVVDYGKDPEPALRDDEVAWGLETVRSWQSERGSR